jgi:hypothetical protein
MGNRMLFLVVLYLCVTGATALTWCTNGTGSVPAQTPCSFPFLFAQALQHKCTRLGWNALWCSTTLYYDIDKKWGDCTPCIVPVPGCLHEGSLFHNGSEVCINGTNQVCEASTWSSLGPCSNGTECLYGNTTYLEYDFICENGSNSQCKSGSFVPLGNCSPPAFANCSLSGQLCGKAFSTDLNEFLVFCGQNGNFSSATSLCYADNGEYVCGSDKAGSGQNWIVRSVNSTHRGIACPAY